MRNPGRDCEEALQKTELGNPGLGLAPSLSGLRLTQYQN